ncbi:hypothetical protein BDZ89DRAFT_1216997 [Hymenopellis radicata]|nr:hypothetical protein BDZ89DRAFT_1216997 [Hymenopellis radicata]
MTIQQGSAAVSFDPATPPATPAARRAKHATSESNAGGGAGNTIDLTVSDDEDGDLQEFGAKTYVVKQELEQLSMPPDGSSSRPAKEIHHNTIRLPPNATYTLESTHHAGQKRKRAQDEVKDTVLPTLTEPMCFEDFRPKEQNGAFDFSVISFPFHSEENVLASRDELNKQYGCGAFNLIATVPANMSPSPDGEALRLLFPSRDLSPLSVTQAGRPGPLFTSRTDIGVDKTPLHVFSEHTSEDKIRWLYVGEYTLGPAGRIESAQFAGFPANVRRVSHRGQ